jgi:hypothetical protein
MKDTVKIRFKYGAMEQINYTYDLEIPEDRKDEFQDLSPEERFEKVFEYYQKHKDNPKVDITRHEKCMGQFERVPQEIEVLG